LEGVPFDFPKGIIPNVRGKVVDDKGEHVEGLYVVGWLKRGPSGIIGSNKWDAADTVVSILSDIGNDKLTTKPSVCVLLSLNIVDCSPSVLG
jgi:ferredoxin--NADP+ reductase